MRLIAEASDIARGFKPLILPHHAPKTLFGTGARSGRQSGPGEDFFQYRDYVFGDDAKQIDWRRSARGDGVLMRERERLLPHDVYLECDNSPAMQFNSRPHLPTKAYAAQRLLLAAAQLLMQGESRMMALRGVVSRPQVNLMELADAISQTHEGGALPPLPSLKPHSYILIVSDFRQGATQWKNFVTRASEMGAVGACVQILDPMEHEFPLYGRVRLDSAENDDSILIASADAMRPLYLERLAREQNSMQKLCATHGWRWLSLTTDTPPRAQLGHVLQALASHE